MPYICSEFPDAEYDTYAEAELDTIAERGIDYINGDSGYICEVEN